jgi:hypothetical protein
MGAYTLADKSAQLEVSLPPTNQVSRPFGVTGKTFWARPLDSFVLAQGYPFAVLAL